MALLVGLLLTVAAHAKDLGDYPVTLSVKQEKLEQVFKKLEAQVPFKFVYNADFIGKQQPLDVDVTRQPLDKVLAAILGPLKASFRLDGKNILVTSPKPETALESLAGQPALLHGRIITAYGLPIADATITLQRSQTMAVSASDGNFNIPVSFDWDSLVVSHIGYKVLVMMVNNHEAILHDLVLEENVASLAQVTVQTGYQSIPKERATGSFVQIDNTLFNRSVSTDVLSRLDGVASGVIFNKNATAGNTTLQPNQSLLTIRGRSTLFANPNPLIVLDNFPYDGDIQNINPNDVESVTLLKDAAAASIWGARSSNGVIVITTKKGLANHATTVSFNTNISIWGKPDPFYQPRLGAADYISVEKYLFKNGWYDGELPYPDYYVLSPAVEIMAAGINVEAELNKLGTQDFRKDLQRYFLQKTVNQQYALNVSGGGLHNQYYFSAGFDNDRPGQVGGSYQRITLNGNNTYRWLGDRISLTTGIWYTQSRTVSDDNYNTGYVYEKLADADGNPLPVTVYHTIGYTDTVGQGKLADWHYRPLQEVRAADNTAVLQEYRVSARLTAKLWRGLEASGDYQYSGGTTNNTNNYSPLTYYNRDLYNNYAQLDYSTGNVTSAIPMGNIIDLGTNSYQSTSLRGQLNYSHSWSEKHALNVIAGAEMKNYTAQNRAYRLYGYDPSLQTSQPMDYTMLFPLFDFGYAQVPNNIQNLKVINRFVDYYANAAYTWRNALTFSFSSRRDESNLFGVHTNQKGVPLGSAGLKWRVSNESFYHLKWLPELALRLTDGYNGNLDNNASAYTTASYSFITNVYGQHYNSIQNPPNPSLRWEKDHMVNAGIDFGTKGQRITGSVEYYSKKGTSLLGSSAIAPQTGINQFYGNTADMSGQGIDIVLHTKNTSGELQWLTDFLFNYTTDKVTAYHLAQSSISTYVTPGFINPVVGRPLYSLFSYRYAGLDASGNPQGMLDGKVSEDYQAIFTSLDFANLHYNGPVNPPVFGSLRNTFTYRSFSLSFNITYKFGYYFRRPSINYTDLFNGGVGHPDYAKRWQQPGDEAKTNVPAMVYPADPGRDYLYTYSDALVDKGDHIRLQDIQFSYRYHRLKFYLYASNLGILWKANHDGIDPDYVPGSGSIVYHAVKTISFGIRADF